METQPHTLEAYMKEHYPMLLRFAKKKLGTSLRKDWRVPEDAVSDTFLILARKLECGEIVPEKNVAGLLYKILVRRCIDILEGLHKSVEGELDAPLLGTDGTLVEIIIDNDPHNDPEQMALLQEKKDAVQDCVNSLPEIYRNAVILVCLQEWEYKEAAEALKIPVGTVKGRVHMAKKQLKPCLEKKEVIKCR